MRPVAEHLAAVQEAADLPNWHKRHDSFRQVADRMAELAPRMSDEALDVAFPLALPAPHFEPARIVEEQAGEAAVVEEFVDLDEQIVSEQREEHPEWDWD